ncbi:hypothetical protein L218DRAFT_182601 [Marasmius fiardii PR-910]|nr:hypothetical protein L218DRAFT_182601 [Marasmius fiardii PR-910]
MNATQPINLRVDNSGFSVLNLNLTSEVHRQSLPLDIVLSILNYVTDKNSLYNCARTCRSFYDLAIPNLYKSLSLIVVRSYKSALESRPRLGQYVEAVEVTLEVFDYHRHQDRFTPFLTTLSYLPNITSFTIKHTLNVYFNLPIFLTDLIVAALSPCEKLETLSLLSAISPFHIKEFSRLRFVKAVRFGCLPNESLAALEEWFRQAEGRFHTLSIVVPYAIGPRDIGQLFPFVSNLHTLHIGRDHSLTPQSLLSLLEHTPRLQFLDMRYHGFMALGLVSKRLDARYLSRLEIIVIRYYGFSNLSSSHDLHHWIECVTSSSPLKSFSLLSDDGRKYELSRDLLNILCSKSNLEILNIPDVLIGPSELVTIMRTFKQLRVLSLFLSDVKLLDFYRSVGPGDLELTSLSAIYLRPLNSVNFPYASVAGLIQKAIEALIGNPGHVHIWDTEERDIWQALWTITHTTERLGIDLLNYEYPEMYAHMS